MAANYNSFDDYIKAQESKYPDDRKIGSNATNYASRGAMSSGLRSSGCWTIRIS